MPLSRINSASIANSAISAADIADGTITAAKIISVANTQITGTLSVANTSITGNIISSQITSVGGSQITANTVANSAFQTGSVENYMNAAGLGFGMRNRIINGAMVIDQRNAGASVTVSSNQYTLDRFRSLASGGGAYSVVQSSTAPAGFVNSMVMTVTTTAASPSATNYYALRQSIEGYNIADLNQGTANAKPFTISFWVRSSLTGTFGGSVDNDVDRSHPFTYSISSANTWEQKSVTVTGCTDGTWVTTNGIGINLQFALGAGSSRSGTAGAWASGTYFSATGATNVMATNGATLYITGVQLEKGSTATSFDYRPFGTEFVLCQRYYWRNSVTEAFGWFGLGTCTSATNARIGITLGQTMRTTPTVSAGGNTRVYDGGTAAGASSFSINNNSLVYPQLTVTTSSGLTQGRAAFLGADNNGNTYLAFDAEL